MLVSISIHCARRARGAKDVFIEKLRRATAQVILTVTMGKMPGDEYETWVFVKYSIKLVGKMTRSHRAALKRYVKCVGIKRLRDILYDEIVAAYIQLRFVIAAAFCREL